MQTIAEILVVDEREMQCNIHGAQIEKSFMDRWTGCPICLDIKAKELKQREAMERHQQAMDENLKRAGIPALYQNIDFDSWKVTDKRQLPKIVRVRAYADELFEYKQAKNLVLSGSTGTGKSHIISCIVKYVAQNKLIRIRFMSSAAVMSRINDSRDFKSRTEYESEILDQLGNIPVLVLDDVGAKDDIKGRQDLFFTIIDRRYNSHLPTLITTNLSEEQLREYIGDRAFDRLTQRCVWIECVWQSYRKINSTFERV